MQIKVPPELAQVLKDYTKEVIRRQPEDLIEFSAHYFSNLANIIPAQHQFPPPSISQISHTYKAVANSAVRTCEVCFARKCSCCVPDAIAGMCTAITTELTLPSCRSFVLQRVQIHVADFACHLC